jgi:hypothetical protein
VNQNPRSCKDTTTVIARHPANGPAREEPYAELDLIPAGGAWKHSPDEPSGSKKRPSELSPLAYDLLGYLRANPGASFYELLACASCNPEYELAATLSKLMESNLVDRINDSYRVTDAGLAVELPGALPPGVLLAALVVLFAFILITYFVAVH